jgi:regulatory protein
VATELLGELGIRRGEIMPDAYEALEQAGKVSQAMRRALSVLSCGANSTRTLEQKLRARGFSAEISAQAVRRLADKGYLCEGQDACRVAQRSLDKGWGLRRIIEDLRCRGYGKNALEDARSMLSCEDFTARCCRAARKKMRTYPSTLTERQKLTAFLMRYGYDADEIRRAIRPETWSGDGEM